MHTQQSRTAALLAAARDVHWSYLPVVIAAVAFGALAAGWAGAGIGGAVVIATALVVVNSDRVLALLARLPGRAGAPFRDPGGPDAVERYRDAVDALDQHRANEPDDACSYDQWGTEAQRLTDVRDAAGERVSFARRVLGW